MYLPNKYTKWYYKIINRAQARDIVGGYFEKHHIIPRSLGGDNRKENIVRLTAREHFICHRLLTKMTEGVMKSKMTLAVWRMAVKGRECQLRFIPNARTYEHLRIQFSLLQKGKITSKEIKDKISKANKGKPAWNKGIPRSAEEKQLMSNKRKETAKDRSPWNLGKTHSSDTINKIKEKAKNRTKHACPHCLKKIAGSNYFRWHGDNCKNRQGERKFLV